MHASIGLARAPRAATRFSRRSLLRGAAGASLAAGLTPRAGASADETSLRPRAGPRVAVVGAGAFGAFTALALQRRGAAVTLLDAWGPGNSRSSSGGDTRVIRGVYGRERIYVELAVEAMALWPELERRFGQRLYRPTGALWLVGDAGEYVREAMPLLREQGLPYEELDRDAIARRWPQIGLDGVRWALHEERAGYLLARRACAAAVDAFVAAGGDYRLAAARPGALAADGLGALALGDGSRLDADAYVFAAGPWLPELFPDLLRDRLRVTRQEVHLFGTPAGDARFTEAGLPVWVDLAERLFYGIPGNEHRGFKVADDTRGEPFDPTRGDRLPSAAGLAAARGLLARRFPALADAPLLEARVCQYENTPDHRFILDRHPRAQNAWLVGGGSGHGFKFAPAWGERVAATVLGERPVDPFFALERLARTAGTGPVDLRGLRNARPAAAP